MANTFTNLEADAYLALDKVSRELTGMIPAVMMDARLDRAAVNTTTYVHVAPVANSSFDITPAMSIPAASDQTIGYTSIVIDKAKGRPFSWNGNEQNRINTGAGYESVRVNQIAQAMRAIVNEVEADLCALYSTTSRAYGTAATTPFGTAGDFTDAAEALRILLDNGAGEFDNQLVINTAAGAKLKGKQASSAVQFDGSLLRQGILQTITGLDIRESAQIKTPTAGAMASATSSSAAFTVGQTTIPLATAGTGVVAAGDVITFANDTNQYVISSVSFAGANPASGDSIVLAAPGLRKAQGAATRAITVIATAARNMVFNRDAIVLATRQPERPQEGDLALDYFPVTDPRTGLTFEVAIYPGNRMVRYEVSLAWGVKNIKPEHTALLLG
jgi:hypothetical protein